MKTRNQIWIIICLMALALTACQADQIHEEICSIDETTGEYDERCIPISSDLEAQDTDPLDEIFISTLELAYPIPEEDLTLLLREWRLSTHTEDGIESKPSFKNLTFNAEGSYTIAIETWIYRILQFKEDLLNLRTWHSSVQIDEEYLPADLAYGCQ